MFFGDTMKKISIIIFLSLLGLLLMTYSFFSMREILVNREIATESNNQIGTTPQLEITSAAREKVYPLVVGEGIWLEYEVFSANNFQLLPGVTLQPGDRIRFEMTGSSNDKKMGLDMITTVSYEVPVGAVFVNGEKVAEQIGKAGTIAVTFAYPVDNQFWQDYQAVEDNWNQMTAEQGLSYHGEIRFQDNEVLIDFGYTEPGVTQVLGRDGPIEIPIERGVFSVIVDRDTGIMLEQKRDADCNHASYHIKLMDSNTDIIQAQP